MAIKVKADKKTKSKKKLKGNEIVSKPEFDKQLVLESQKHWSEKTNLWLLNFKSSNLVKAGYDLKKSNLYIQFDNNSNYKYSKVSLDWWHEFTLSKSKGKFFSARKYDLINVEKI